MFVYTIQTVVKNEQLFVQHGCQTGCQTRFDNLLYRVYKHSTCCQTVFVKPVVQPGLTTGSFNTVVKPVVNQFDNRLDVCLHDTAGCQTGSTTGLTTGCIV